MTTNAEIEERWINAWNDLFDIVGERQQVKCLLPDGSVVDLDTCKGWLQNSAYQGYCLKVEMGWIKGEQGAIVSRFEEDSDEQTQETEFMIFSAQSPSALMDEPCTPTV